MPIDAVIFDIGNVLLKFDYYIAANKLLAVTGKTDYPTREKVTETVHAYERGAISRREFITKIREQFDHPGGDDEFLRIWENIFEPNIPMVDLLPYFAAKQRLFLLSNIGCIHQEFIFRNYEFFSRFESGVYSYRAKYLKPSREIFQIAHESFGIIPQRTLYIDDMEENVKAAETYGFIAIHYDHKRHENFERELSERKIHPLGRESLTPPPTTR